MAGARECRPQGVDRTKMAAHGKIGRNEPCPCGSGKKYKRCHIGQELPPRPLLSLHERNRVILSAAADIFGFAKGRSWADFKKNLSGKEVRKLYEVQAALWPPDTDWSAMTSWPDDNKLRALYLGDVKPELILRNLLRFSLYSDELLIVDPLINPWIIKPEFNPIDNPDQYKSDTLKLVYVLLQIAPWIEAGIVKLVPDPGDFNLAFKRETWRLAEQRLGDQKFDEQDFEMAVADGRKDLERMLLALSPDQLLAQLRRAGQKLTPEQEKEVLAYSRRMLRDDPLALEQPPGESFKGGQMIAMRSGANHETAMMMCAATGAFPHTNMRTRWQEILSAHDELSETARMWSPFAKAFQSLEFRFLNNVDARFAQSIREDGRLEHFRSLLRKIGKGAEEIKDLGALDRYARDCKDELIGQYRQAEAEWTKIEEDLVKWGAGGIGAALLAGHFLPDISALSAGALGMVGQLGLRFFKRGQFRKANPMSVFIDLSRKETAGTTMF
jgi:hypothetical protein